MDARVSDSSSIPASSHSITPTSTETLIRFTATTNASIKTDPAETAGKVELAVVNLSHLSTDVQKPLKEHKIRPSKLDELLSNLTTQAAIDIRKGAIDKQKMYIDDVNKTTLKTRILAILQLIGSACIAAGFVAAMIFTGGGAVAALGLGFGPLILLSAYKTLEAFIDPKRKINQANESIAILNCVDKFIENVEGPHKEEFREFLSDLGYNYEPCSLVKLYKMNNLFEEKLKVKFKDLEKSVTLDQKELTTLESMDDIQKNQSVIKTRRNYLQTKIKKIKKKVEKLVNEIEILKRQLRRGHIETPEEENLFNPGKHPPKPLYAIILLPLGFIEKKAD